MILPILTHPNSILRQKTEKIDPAKIKSSEIQKLIFNMQETVESAGGIGLAAPQIGHLVKIIVINLEDQKMVLINPEITYFSWRKAVGEEGCLSIPEKFGLVKRSKAIKVKAFDKNGQKLKFKAKGLLARVIQHEVDHLDGVLFIDKAEKIFGNNAPAI